MPIIDMHCDTILGLLEKEDRNLESSLYENDLCVDIQKLQRGDYLVQNFALFTDQKSVEIPESQTMRLYDKYCRELEKYADWIAPVYSFQDIEENAKNHKISSLLTLEDGGVVFDDLAMLRNYYRMGVRMIALTWNYENGIGYPNLSMEETNHDYKLANFLQRVDTVRGLTDFGIQYIQEMERLGMIIDVSHLNDAGFYDVLEYTTKPFVASHSNARSICPVARNMSDDMIMELAKRGGVMGLNFCGDFLALHDKPNGPSQIEDMVTQIEYIKNLAGIDVIGLGTDFDGISSKLEIEDASKMYLLADALREHGFTQEEIDKIFYKNVYRVYQEVLR